MSGKSGHVSFGTTRDNKLFPHTCIAYVSNLNKRNIKIVKINHKHNNKIMKSEQTLVSDLPEIQFISVSNKNRFLAVVGGEGDKVNLYSLKTYKAKKYFWRGYSKATIIDMIFDNSDKYLCLLSTNGTFHIYPITQNSNDQNSDLNSIEDGEQEYYNYGRKKNKYVKNFFKNVRKKFSSKYKESYAKYKDNKVLTSKIVYFYFTPNLEITAIDELGNIFIIKFNKHKGGMCWLHQRLNFELANI